MHDRVNAMHLAERLPARSFGHAAFSGLQDTAPRAALLSLHARVDGVGPHDWEHPSLVQVWGPRSAVYLIPTEAFAAFTVGRMPRDPQLAARVHRVADEALAGAADPYRRTGSATGRFRIRWDARTTELIPCDPPDVDPDEARVDLARRFLAWFGEALRPRFATWAGVSSADARETLRHVAEQPAVPHLPATGVRLLPYLDPFLWGVPAPSSGARELSGALLVDGVSAGTWARQGAHVTLRPVPGAPIDRIVAEAETLAGPLGVPAVRISVAP